MNRIALIGLPWAKPDQISIQIGCLKAFLRFNGINVQSRHYYKDILSYISEEDYYDLYCNNLGEYLSLALLFPERRGSVQKYVSKILGRNTRTVSMWIREVDRMLDDIIDDVLTLTDTNRAMVGFSTSLQQVVLSLVAAKRLKSKRPDIITVFGGAIMLQSVALELMKKFPQVDLTIFGEGELSFLELSRQLMDNGGGDLSLVPNLVYRNGNSLHSTKHIELEDLDELPIPDYSDYFNHKLKSTLLPIYPAISVETSRGCFYGKCSFCNLNAQWLSNYRAKNDEQVFNEIQHQVNAYSSNKLLFVDSNVSNRDRLFDMMARDEYDFYGLAEVSGHLSRNAFQSMRSAGIKEIQIGIEAFSGRLLSIFKKGVTVMRNMEILKWAAEMGYKLYYNIILGSPSERKGDLNETLRVLNYAKYYQPPEITHYMLTIDSPAFRDMDTRTLNRYHASCSATQRLIPIKYRNVLSPLLSTFVGYRLKAAHKNKAVTKEIEKRVGELKDLYERNHHEPALTFQIAKEFIVISDYSDSLERITVLTEPAKSIYLSCVSESKSLDEICITTGMSHNVTASMLKHLADKGLIFHSENRYLALAVYDKKYGRR